MDAIRRYEEESTADVSCLTWLSRMSTDQLMRGLSANTGLPCRDVRKHRSASKGSETAECSIVEKEKDNHRCHWKRWIWLAGTK